MKDNKLNILTWIKV